MRTPGEGTDRCAVEAGEEAPAGAPATSATVPAIASDNVLATMAALRETCLRTTGILPPIPLPPITMALSPGEGAGAPATRLATQHDGNCRALAQGVSVSSAVARGPSGAAHDAGFSTIDSNRMAPLELSRTRNRKGRLMCTNFGNSYADETTPIPVAAAAVVPLGVTCR